MSNPDIKFQDDEWWDGNYCIIALAGDQEVGAASYEVEKGLIHLLEVEIHEDFRNQGLGTRLVSMIKARFEGGAFKAECTSLTSVRMLYRVFGVPYKEGKTRLPEAPPELLVDTPCRTLYWKA